MGKCKRQRKAWAERMRETMSGWILERQIMLEMTQQRVKGNLSARS